MSGAVKPHGVETVGVETSEELLAALAEARRRIGELEALEARFEGVVGALRESEALLDAIVDNIPDMLFVKDAKDLRFVRFNKAGERLLGYTRDELLGKGDHDFFPTDEADFFISKDRAVLQSGALLDIPEEPIDTRLQGTRILHTKKVPLFDDAGLPRYLLGISEDITERKRAEEALRAERDRARRMLDVAGVGLVLLDRRGRVSLINPEGCRILACAEHEALGEDWFATFLPERLREPVFAVFERLMAGEIAPVERYENAVLTKTGEERVIAFHNTVTHDAAGEIDGVLFSAEDITDRRAAQEERRRLEVQFHQAQKLESLGVLAGGIAHDFNNILAALLGNTELALEDVLPDAPLRVLLLEIQQAGQQAAQLTAQMLAYSGQGRLVVEAVDLSALLREMSSLLGSAVSKKASLEYQLCTDLPAVRADPTQLRQIALNLVINAAEALGDQDGRVRIETSTMVCDLACIAAALHAEDLTPGRYVVLEVSDTGCGMDEATQARIFDPFYSTKFTGRGLGLAAVQGIVRGHAGAVLVDSSPGEGTTFKVLLPAVEQAAAEREEQVEPPARASATTILLVDDEAMVRRAARRLLERLGLSVLEAVDGVEAVELFRAHQAEICCVILDLTMPRMGGAEAYEAIRQLDEHVPVILSSGYSAQESTARFRDKDLAGFLAKPFDGATLRRVLRAALGGKLPAER